jgi:hypothetical protein
VVVISGFALVAIDKAHGVLESRTVLALAIAAGSVVLRRLVSLVFHSPR